MGNDWKFAESREIVCLDREKETTEPNKKNIPV